MRVFRRTSILKHCNMVQLNWNSFSILILFYVTLTAGIHLKPTTVLEIINFVSQTVKKV